MVYSVIQPPFTLQFPEMSKTELIAYAEWFHDIAPERITELAKAVRCTAGYETWRPDCSLDSLNEFGHWFEKQVETRKRSTEEILEIQKGLKFPIEIPDEELTNRTFSLAMDIGMYFAQVVLKNLEGTYWDQIFGSKRFVDYGQPVIMGFGKVPLNPV